MKVAVMSDSHDNVPYIKKAIDYFNANAFEYLLHAGDIVSPFAAKSIMEFKGKIYAVYGNNDGDKNNLRKIVKSIEPGPFKFTLGGRRIIIVHDILDLRDRDFEEVDIVICGHTHKAYTEDRGETLVINPGETCGWLTGKHTVGVLDIHNREFVEINLDKPGK